MLPQFLKNPILTLKTAFHTFQLRTWLFIGAICMVMFLLFMVDSFPVSFHVQKLQSSSNQNSLMHEHSEQCNYSLNLDTCTNGRFYVYDLPPMLNKDLVDNCEDLIPGRSLCEALSNNGFGARAMGLTGVVPEGSESTWYSTNQFASEVMFHNKMKGHECRTLDPESAQAFYIPFYAGLAVGKYLFANYSAQQRDFHCQTMLDWVQNQTYWKRSNGCDHFIVLGRIVWDFSRYRDEGWGSSFLHMPAMKNVTRLLIERNPSNNLDVGVPYPTGFHPRTYSDVKQWQNHVRARNRTHLFSFAGGKRAYIKDDFRGFLLQYCYNESDACQVVDCGELNCTKGNPVILETFLDSDFCLQPRGDSYTRRSMFDCMVAGSIPVFFWRRTAYDQYEWFLPAEPGSYSVFIDRRDVKNGTSIRAVLEKISREDIKKMREKVIEYIPKFVYARPIDRLDYFRDAFDLAIDGVLNRFKSVLH